MVSVVELGDDDVTAFDQLNSETGRPLNDVCQKLADPRARGVDNCACLHLQFASIRSPERGPPNAVTGFCGNASRAGPDRSAEIGGGPRYRHNQARIVHGAVGIDEPLFELGLETGTVRARPQIDRAGCL